MHLCDAAYYGLKELGALRKGMTVLIHSAAGGVGLQVRVQGPGCRDQDFGVKCAGFGCRVQI